VAEQEEREALNNKYAAQKAAVETLKNELSPLLLGHSGFASQSNPDGL
jgi:hypothetical protein